jgi:hypothetical protein
VVDIGPIELLAIGLGPEAEYNGQILVELERLEGKGLLRVLDLLFVAGDVEADELVALNYQGDELGGLVGALLGFPFEGEPPPRTITVDAPPGGELVGLTPGHLQDLVTKTPSDLAIGVLLIEHVWARDFKASIRHADAYPLVEGFLSSDVLADITLDLEKTVRVLDELERHRRAPATATPPTDEQPPGGVRVAMEAGKRLQEMETYRTVNRMHRRRGLSSDVTTREGSRR